LLEAAVDEGFAGFEEDFELAKIEAEDGAGDTDAGKYATCFKVVRGALGELKDDTEILLEGENAAGFGQNFVALVDSGTQTMIVGAVVRRKAVPIARRDRNVRHEAE
jgi:hypothetical protein